jgi:glutathione synthase/RimK-type ligase-like ATP-grasp enzyme
MNPSSVAVDVLVLYEHPDWQKPLFSALARQGVSYEAMDLSHGVFDPMDLPQAQLVFNQASPSASVRGHDRAVPFAAKLLRTYEAAGVPVVNGHQAFSLELSKSAQLALMKRLGVAAPRTLVFDDVDTLAQRLETEPFTFPALLKPDQGGSGARMVEVDDFDAIREAVRDPALWTPDPVLLLQEKLDYDPEHGIVRLELLGGQLLYAMRVVSHGAFNLCPSELCNPSDGEGGACAVPPGPKVEFYPYPEVPQRAVRDALRIAHAGGLDIAGVEYAEVRGQPVFYDVNANSNLRPAIAESFGFDPFERVVEYLKRRITFRDGGRGRRRGC